MENKQKTQLAVPTNLEIWDL